MSKEKYNLLVVAHPDDESLFFSGLLLSRKDHPWKVVCVTDGNADGKGAARMREFAKACSRLGAQDSVTLGFPDIFDKRISLAELQYKLQAFPDPQAVFTHGPLGEYGHPHHQDVCRAVYEAYRQRPVYSPAYNCYPEFKVHLAVKDFAIKSQILRDIYLGETLRFVQFYPVSADEGFVNFSYQEVCALYDFLALGQELRTSELQHYLWFTAYLPSIREHSQTRPF